MSLGGRLRTALLSGTILLAPIAITGYLLWIILNLVSNLVRPVAQTLGLSRLLGELAFAADVLAAVVCVVAVAAVGLLTQWRVTRQLMGRLGRLANVVPLVNTVYGTVRSVADALVERESRYEEVVLVEYPREGVYAIGLVTGRSDAFDAVEESLATVFFPNSPNPTGGRLALVPESEIHEVEVSVRYGLRMLVTTGIGVDRAGQGDIELPQDGQFPDDARFLSEVDPASVDHSEPDR